jgi:hypothetical protein
MPNDILPEYMYLADEAHTAYVRSDIYRDQEEKLKSLQKENEALKLALAHRKKPWPPELKRAIDRVEAMCTPHQQTWDLSPNDTQALKAILHFLRSD